MEGKTVIITGGSLGIGKAMAEVFGARGSKILITGRKTAALEDAVAALKSQGIEAASLQADVSKEEDNKRMAEMAMDTYGKIDVLINNAGISMRALFEEVDLEVIRQVMDINFYGALYATKYCLPSIIEQKGAVVGISSIAGFRGLPARVGYSASKFALQGFLEALRTEMLYKGVHVLTACPGFTASNIRNTALVAKGITNKETPRNEAKMMTAEDCAAHIYKAVVKRKKFLVLTNQGKLTVWLNKWAPGFMDKLVFNEMANEKDSPLQKVKA